MAQNHESLLSRIVNAFGKGARVDGPELAAAIENAKASMEKTTSDAHTAPGQEPRDISAAVTCIRMQGGAVRLVVKQGAVPSMLVECSRASSLGYVLTEVSGHTLAIDCKPVTIVSSRQNSGLRISGRGNSVVQINNGLGSIQIGSISINGSNNKVSRVFSGDVVNTGPISFTTSVDAKGNVVSTATGLDNPIVESEGLYLATVTVVLPNANDLVVNGSADIEYKGFALDDLSVDISGSGSVVLSGAAAVFNAEISGAGTIKAAELVAQRAGLRVSGAGSIKVHVTEKVRARISGAGSVKVLGNPDVRDTHVSGAGEVKFK